MSNPFSGEAEELSGYISIDLSNILRNVLSLSIGSGVAQGLMAISFLLTSRVLGSERLGSFTASFSTVGALSIFFNWGLDSWLLRAGTQKSKNLEVLWGTALFIKVLLGTPWLISIVFILPRLNPETFAIPLIVVSALTTWLEGIFGLNLIVLKTLLRNSTTALLLIVSRGAILILTLIFVYFDLREPLAFAWIRLGVVIGALFISFASVPAHFRIGSCTLIYGIWQKSCPFAISDLFTSVYVQADMAIAAVALTKKAVGMYAPASSLINALFIVPSAGYFVAVPVLVRVLQRGHNIKKTLLYTFLGFAGIGGGLWLVTWFTSSFVSKHLLGSTFFATEQLLRILSPVIFLKSCSFAFAAILVSVGRQKRRVSVQALAAVSNIVFNLIFVRRLGIQGVARIHVISEALLMTGYLVLVVCWIHKYASPLDKVWYQERKF